MDSETPLYCAGQEEEQSRWHQAFGFAWLQTIYLLEFVTSSFTAFYASRTVYGDRLVPFTDSLGCLNLGSPYQLIHRLFRMLG
ncbi:hypothetical protein ACFSCZ_09010 [Siminovitchia sediminis]|uniref:Uncharacterized protein n=1 Tax=Siminovitchia sediminis TaxID=1274353 RepID=A0ABW4KI61_9BACI